ncbi:hypothetical protein OS493_022313 [Desmophyllum pertusum]|uniref:Uncharacterized protein n=1 Tax=Desmophyllum pertusum TaxID=174260 RepID=A0A9X0A0A1_9CNID|nr:hypothetical protein OS493_022313 [Desmophyllum pertusum]
MNRLFEVIVLVILMTVAFLRNPTDAIDIGKCSLNTFTYEGQVCQRIMMIDLKLNPGLSCSVAYADLKTCLKKYVTGCVKDDPLLKDMAGQITKLLLLQAYNCGDQTVDLSDIHDFLWLVTKCKPERANKALDCWNDFHSVFDQSRNDVFKLCEPYAKAKMECAEVARAECEGLCQHMVKDQDYNPFCKSRKDPGLYNITSKCSDLHAKIECSNSYIYDKAMECEDQGAEKFANEDDFSCSKEKDRKRKCLQENIDTCVTNTRLFDDTEKVLQGTLTNERLFCNRTSLDINSLLQNVKPLADCKQQFFDDAETCAKPFRKIFLTSTSAERKTDKTCSEYKTEYKKARECINKARKKDCKFNDDVLDITARINNPFCSQGTSKSLSTMLQLAVSIIPFMFFA